MKNLVLVFGLLLPVFSQAAVPVPQAKAAYQPKPYTATYVVFRNGKDLGKATVKFFDSGNGRWELTSNTIGTGIAAIAGVAINEHSQLRWNDGKPETVEYSFSQKAGWKNKQRSLKIDAQGKTIASQDNEKSYSLKYQPGVLDRHAINVAVMQDLSQGKRGDLLYTVADRDEVNNHLYRVIGNEKTETALGVLNSVKVQRIRETSNGRITTLWLGSDKQFVPIRIEQKEGDGDVIEMRITGLR
ncbi:MAG: DUF3108 domain-containing protein [Arenimonas sp.]